MTADCKSVTHRVNNVGSTPTSPTIYCCVVQIAERSSHKGVGGSASLLTATICLCGEKVDTVPSKGAVLSGVLVQLQSQAPFG